MKDPVLENYRTLIVCTRIGRSLGLCPNIFSSTDPFIDENLIRQGITSSDEQVKFFIFFLVHFEIKNDEKKDLSRLFVYSL